MSYTFSRRAFLKYSAATAVAVAGASLQGRKT
ncbi:twin-arginine translocation signal domain-containing protein, partial [Enterococcus durans]|nr:twin-arginine translocation signal domain-containing protein [Enterococcus durans]